MSYRCVFSLFQAKIHYLDIISGLPSYGAKCFSTNQRDGIERVLLISPRFGLSQIAGVRNSVVSTLFLKYNKMNIEWVQYSTLIDVN